MKKVVAWGLSVEYDLYRRWIEPEILKGNMEITALILNDEGYLRSIDGIPVIKLEDLLHCEYDYLIDMNSNRDPAIGRIFEILNVPNEKVIPLTLFKQPFFDLKRWEAVQKNGVSIIANNCWGGFTCKSVGLRFNSPFINMWMNSNDYLTMVENFKYYMDIEPRFIRMEYDRVLGQEYPVVGLDDVEIHWNHYTDFEEALQIWNRRKARINYENVLIEMFITNKEDLQRFLKLPQKYKVGFSSVPCDEECIVYIPVNDIDYFRERYKNDLGGLIMHMAHPAADECRQYDVLKLLNHEKDFLRAKM